MSQRRYVLITPCRDEAAYLQTTIDSVAAQTVPPACWVIVDDGSTDDTPDILAAAAKKYSYIKVITRTDRGGRSVGPGVIEAFYAGLDSIDIDDYDYLCKLDGDLDIPARYFERLMERFEEDAWLGTCSGKLFLRYDDQLVEERCGDENSVGPSKFYATACFRDIGGFVRQVSWDGIDGHVCRLRGWVARSVDEPDLRLIHLRRMGSSHRSFWEGRKRWGRGKYFMGSRLYYVCVVGFYRMFERPWIISGLGIVYGWLQAALKREQRYSDPEYLKGFRAYEFRNLVLGRHRNMEQTHARVRATFPPKRSAATSAAPAQKRIPSDVVVPTGS
jgi:glycosyltransferase involved in cell wall biosynthesis